MSSLVSIDDVWMEFPVRGGFFNRTIDKVHAVSGVSLEVNAGDTIGIVGESGCGKTTFGRVAIGLTKPTRGSVSLNGKKLDDMSRSELQDARKSMQLVFQDPYSSLNPRHTVAHIVGEPLRIHGVPKSEIGPRVDAILDHVGLEPSQKVRYPHEFSGGQRQRIGIARALILEPSFVVFDEPVSALDVSVQAGVIELLKDLKDRLGFAYLFISHDLSVVRTAAERVAVMYLGKLVEVGQTADVFASPSHPYTKALLSAAPIPSPDIERSRQRIVLRGDVPNPIDPPSGCRFRTRCWKAQDICAEVEPTLDPAGNGTVAACHFPEN